MTFNALNTIDANAAPVANAAAAAEAAFQHMVDAYDWAAEVRETAVLICNYRSSVGLDALPWIEELIDYQEDGTSMGIIQTLFEWMPPGTHHAVN